MPFRLLLRAVALLATLCTGAAVAAGDDDLASQRQRFSLVWEAAQHGPDLAWRKLAPGLESYPLYPYLELAALKRRIGEVMRAEVEAFLAAWPDTLPAQQLRESFLEELARRSAWKDFVDLYTS